MAHRSVSRRVVLGIELLSLGLLVSAQPGQPTCALNNGTACPPPTWPAQWNLTLSTTCYPNSQNSYFVPPASQPWGLVPVSWTNAMPMWVNPNPLNSTCEAAMIQGCALIKQTSSATRCMRYNNMELALDFLESNRVAMHDPSKADFFLQYRDANGNKNGTIYDAGTPGAGLGSCYFWDYTNPAALKYVVQMVADGVDDPSLDGTFTDDEVGFPVEHESAPAAMGMTVEQTAEVAYWAQVASALVIDAIVAKGKYVYQAFYANSNQGGNVGPAPSAATCTSFMTTYCAPSFQNQAITMQFDPNNANQTLAAFLIVRPPIAYLGSGWASDQSSYSPLFLWDVGEPQGLCTQPAPGIFQREWTYGNVSLDCNVWVAYIPTRSS